MFLGWFRHLLPQLRVKQGKVGIGLLEVCVKLGKVGKGRQRCVYRKKLAPLMVNVDGGAYQIGQRCILVKVVWWCRLFTPKSRGWSL